MLYEPWIESASSYNELRDKLKNKGYSHLSIGASPMLDMKAYENAPKADTSSCKICKSMLRKKK